MPTLDWIGKSAVVEHHKEVPFRLLKCQEDLSVGKEDSGNLLIQGDNLEALKALLPYYAGQVKCIYIDPPYNTGDESWVYNDAVNSPEINKWLGKVVDRDDLTRHDKWLCMLYPRLQLLRKFLCSDGVIFVSIDENEFGNLRLLMDEIFGEENQLGTLVWKRRSSSAMRGTPLSIDHEYLFIYAFDAIKATLYGLEKKETDYPYEDERGRFASTDLTVGMNKEARPGQFYPIKNPRTGKIYDPNPDRVWRFYPDTMEKVIEDDLIIWPDEQEGQMQRPRYKTYYDPAGTKPKPVSSWIETANTNDRPLEIDAVEYDLQILSSGMNQEGGRILQRILGRKVFAYPKPISLIRSLIRATTRKNDIILDSFAGTGTTAHAVLDLNIEDGGERQFILVEIEDEIAQNITAERLKRVIEGYTYQSQKGKDTIVDGLGGSFRYCELGETLFGANGQIREEISFEDLARHVYFSETGQPLPETYREQSPLLGIKDGVAVYLLFNGIVKDKSANGGNMLTRPLLAKLPKHDGPKVIYGNGTLLSEHTMQEMGIIFRQVPYEIKVG